MTMIIENDYYVWEIIEVGKTPYIQNSAKSSKIEEVTIFNLVKMNRVRKGTATHHQEEVYVPTKNTTHASPTTYHQFFNGSFSVSEYVPETHPVFEPQPLDTHWCGVCLKAVEAAYSTSYNKKWGKTHKLSCPACHEVFETANASKEKELELWIKEEARKSEARLRGFDEKVD